MTTMNRAVNQKFPKGTWVKMLIYPYLRRPKKCCMETLISMYETLKLTHRCGTLRRQSEKDKSNSIVRKKWLPTPVRNGQCPGTLNASLVQHNKIKQMNYILSIQLLHLSVNHFIIWFSCVGAWHIHISKCHNIACWGWSLAWNTTKLMGKAGEAAGCN